LYLLLDGYHKTRDVEKYEARLILFWVISEIPYCFAFGYHPWESQNIFLTLVACLAVFIILDKESLSPCIKALLVACLAITAAAFHMEQSWYAIILAAILYYHNPNNMETTIMLIIAAGAVYAPTNFLQPTTALSVLLFPHHKEFSPSSCPSSAASIMCYLFYPIHLLFLKLLTI